MATRLALRLKSHLLRRRPLWTYALTFSCIAGFIVIVLNSFQDQLVFYVTPTDALDKYTTNPSKSKFRLGGLVLEGSVVQPASSPEMEFVITDLMTDILVRYRGSLPDLFREGHSVVVEGFVKPFTDEIRKEVSKASPGRRGPETVTSRRLRCWRSTMRSICRGRLRRRWRRIRRSLRRRRRPAVRVELIRRAMPVAEMMEQ